MLLLKSETLASAYTERFFYNIDIESGKELNLRDVLGNDYKQIVDETIYKEIEERSKNQIIHILQRMKVDFRESKMNIKIFI